MFEVRFAARPKRSPHRHGRYPGHPDDSMFATVVDAVAAIEDVLVIAAGLGWPTERDGYMITTRRGKLVEPTRAEKIVAGHGALVSRQAVARASR